MAGEAQKKIFKNPVIYIRFKTAVCLSFIKDLIQGLDILQEGTESRWFVESLIENTVKKKNFHKLRAIDELEKMALNKMSQLIKWVSVMHDIW